MESPRRIESYLLDGAAGKLECLLEEPEVRATDVCLVCHPHPLFGGTMHNKVVYRTARALRRSGSVVLRFNYRGVGASEGVHDNGVGELEDAGILLEWLRKRYPGLPHSVAGFSFGSRIALRLGCSLNETRRIIAVGFPTGKGNFGFLKTCAIPKFFVHSTVDEYGPRPALEEIYKEFAEPKQIFWIDGGNHFFKDDLDALEETIYQLNA